MSEVEGLVKLTKEDIELLRIIQQSDCFIAEQITKMLSHLICVDVQEIEEFEKKEKKERFKLVPKALEAKEEND